MKKMDSMIVLDRDSRNRIRNNYMKACDSRIFRELIATLDTEDEILMKYTSTLMDSAVEFENCKNCTGLSECKNKLKGMLFSPKRFDNRIIFSYVTCHYLEREQYKQSVKLFDMPKALREASMAGIIATDRNRLTIIKYIKDYIADYQDERKMKGVYLHGSFGSGKSYLIAALFNELAKKGVNSVIIHVPEMLRSIKESFDSDYAERFSLLKKTELLLLDDIGAEYLTSWARDEVLEPILQYRMDEGLPTFFTSNFTLEELEKHFSTSSSGVEKVKAKRIIERIKQLSQDIELVSKNMRN